MSGQESRDQCQHSDGSNFRAMGTSGRENDEGTTKDEAHAGILRPFEWLTSPGSLKEYLTSLQLPSGSSALHLGSGSSTVGEYLLEEFHFDRVVEVDKDESILQVMRDQWKRKFCQSTDRKELVNRLQHLAVDFTQTPIPVDDAAFQFIFDKSTLDCCMCSDRSAACLLMEAYRCLAVDGVYMLISFHEPDFLVPLLADLPGAHWEVTCSTMERHVEELGDTKETSFTTHSEQLLTVAICRKKGVAIMNHSQTHKLDLDSVCRHVHQVSDVWFRETHPLLTRERMQQLSLDLQTPVSLTKAYQLLFTSAEREHLTYEHFLEDWHAFQSLEEQDELSDDNNCLISYEVGLRFLEEMQ